MTRSTKKQHKSRRTKSLSPISNRRSPNTRRTRTYSPIRRSPTSRERAHSWKNPTGLTRFHQFNTAAGDPIPNCCTLSNKTTVRELKEQISNINGVNPRTMLIYSTKYKKPLGEKRTNLLNIKNSLYILIDPSITPENLSRDTENLLGLLSILRMHPAGISIPDLLVQLQELDPDIRDIDRNAFISETTIDMHALIEDGLVLERTDETRLNTIIRDHAHFRLPVPPSTIAKCKKYIINISHPYFEARPDW